MRWFLTTHCSLQRHLVLWWSFLGVRCYVFVLYGRLWSIRRWVLWVAPTAPRCVCRQMFPLLRGQRNWIRPGGLCGAVAMVASVGVVAFLVGGVFGGMIPIPPSGTGVIMPAPLCCQGGSSKSLPHLSADMSGHIRGRLWFVRQNCGAQQHPPFFKRTIWRQNMNIGHSSHTRHSSNYIGHCSN